MHVELLQHPGCRAAQATHQLLRECLITLAIPDPVLVRVGNYPSPTVLINGTDVMRPAAEPSAASACRLDIPTREHVLAGLRTHLAAGSVDAETRPGRR